MANKRISDALQKEAIEQLAQERAEKLVTRDIALMLYERYEDDDETPMDERVSMLSVARPQDFAINEHIKYTRFGVQHTFERDGQKLAHVFLVHLYWDGDDDEANVIRRVLAMSHVFGTGEWMPTAPSDPLRPDDFWNRDELGDPPQGWTDDDDYVPLFDNFARKPHEVMQVIRHDVSRLN